MTVLDFVCALWKWQGDTLTKEPKIRSTVRIERFTCFDVLSHPLEPFLKMSPAEKKARKDMKTVCVIGSGARELAIIRRLKLSPRCTTTVRCFGSEPNPAIAELVGSVVVGDDASPAQVLSFCKDSKADLVIVGPPASLSAGVVDALHADGIRALGARQAAAAVSGKDFARGLMKQV